MLKIRVYAERIRSAVELARSRDSNIFVFGSFPYNLYYLYKLKYCCIVIF